MESAVTAALRAANDSCGTGRRSFFHDSEEHVDRLLPILDEMVGEGLVTMEKVRVVKYAPGSRPIAPGSPEKAQ